MELTIGELITTALALKVAIRAFEEHGISIEDKEYLMMRALFIKVEAKIAGRIDESMKKIDPLSN
jgi:hypothetical protein